MKIKLGTSEVAKGDDILLKAPFSAPTSGLSVSSDIAKVIVAGIGEHDQPRLEGVGRYLRSLSDAIDDGVLVA